MTDDTRKMEEQREKKNRIKDIRILFVGYFTVLSASKLHGVEW
jgi:hypothetical protein